MTDDERWNQWNEWFDTILDDVQNALLFRRIFRDVRDIIDANPRIQKPSSFYDWMAGVYAESGLMAVRRQLDLDARSVSLARLLTEIREHPHILSRVRFVALYRPEMRDIAEKEYDRYAGAATAHVDPSRTSSRRCSATCPST